MFHLKHISQLSYKHILISHLWESSLKGMGIPRYTEGKIFAENPGPKWDVLGVYGHFILLLNRFFTDSAMDSKETTVGRQS